MSVVMVIAVIVVLAAVVYLAMGRGGELSAERNDYAPLDIGPVSATDVVLLRPPTGLWGYNMEATDEAMERIAESIRERDVRIVALEQLVTDLSRDQAPMPLLASPYAGARHRRAAAAGAETEAVALPRDAPPTQAVQTPQDGAATEAVGWPQDGPSPEAVRAPYDGPPAEAAQWPREAAGPEAARWPSGDPAAGTGQAPDNPAATEPARSPFDRPAPSADFPGPPERSHD